MRRSPAFFMALIFTITLSAFFFLLFNPADREALALTDGCRGVQNGDQVVVYYLHRKFACRSCKGIEETVMESLERYFPDDFTKGRLAMCIVNLDEPGNRHYLDDFDIAFNSIIVVDRKKGEIARFKNIDKLWDIYPDQKATIELIRDEVAGFLAGS